MRMGLVALLWMTSPIWAQAPAGPPQAAIPNSDGPKSEGPKTEPEQPPAIENHGKPMLVPFQCSDDDMQWAGMSCAQDEPCPVYLELAAAEAVGNRILALGNIHSESITLYSVLLGSEDAGATWREPYERIRGVTLDHIQFVDYQNGWISGETLVPVSRDPFLLITSDGGKTWRLRPVFGDGGGGSIQQFWFESPANGSLVIDHMGGEPARYALYETPNGGETWMIRRTSETPIGLQGAASAALNTGWRVRADARTKSFAIEKRDGAGWSAVASWLVEIATCRPAPLPTPQPPEPAEATPPAQAKPAPSLKRPPPK